jgi:hypothetical protein
MAQQRAQPTSTMKKKNPLDGGLERKKKIKKKGTDDERTNVDFLFVLLLLYVR